MLWYTGTHSLDLICVKKIHFHCGGGLSVLPMLGQKKNVLKKRSLHITFTYTSFMTFCSKYFNENHTDNKLQSTIQILQCNLIANNLWIIRCAHILLQQLKQYSSHKDYKILLLIFYFNLHLWWVCFPDQNDKKTSQERCKTVI